MSLRKAGLSVVTKTILDYVGHTGNTYIAEASQGRTERRAIDIQVEADIKGAGG